MTWTTQAYCTLADVKSALDPSMGSQDDTWLSTLITFAQSDLEAEIGYIFQQDGTSGSPVTRIYDGTGDEWLWIDSLVSLNTVIETTRVTYLGPSGVWQSGSTSQIDITADILLKPNNYINLQVPVHKLVRNSGLSFQDGTQNYAVSGVFGVPYISGQVYPGVPTDITRATIRLAIFYYKMRDTAYSDMVQSVGGIREKYSKDWPEDVKRTIANYQRTRFFSHSGL